MSHFRYYIIDAQNEDGDVYGHFRVVSAPELVNSELVDRT